jgi:hypothetical protein
MPSNVKFHTIANGIDNDLAIIQHYKSNHNNPTNKHQTKKNSKFYNQSNIEYIKMLKNKLNIKLNDKTSNEYRGTNIHEHIFNYTIHQICSNYGIKMSKMWSNYQDQYMNDQNIINDKRTNILEQRKIILEQRKDITAKIQSIKDEFIVLNEKIQSNPSKSSIKILKATSKNLQSSYTALLDQNDVLEGQDNLLDEQFDKQTVKYDSNEIFYETFRNRFSSRVKSNKKIIDIHPIHT